MEYDTKTLTGVWYGSPGDNWYSLWEDLGAIHCRFEDGSTLFIPAPAGHILRDAEIRERLRR